mgnify:CR=1 FL=1
MSRKRGYTIVLVLAMAAMLSISATMLWSSTNTETEITANTYRISQARHAAHSGMSHFISLHLSDEDIEERLLIPETQLTSKTAYEVEAVWIDSGLDQSVQPPEQRPFVLQRQYHLYIHFRAKK